MDEQFNDLWNDILSQVVDMMKGVDPNAIKGLCSTAFHKGRLSGLDDAKAIISRSGLGVSI